MNIQEEINKKLNQIEKEQNLKILFACESGSRAWGFASKDSDYDVRFIYKRDVKEYLKIQGHKDTLELPIEDELDFSGWDIRKFLLHLFKSNAVMFEWLQSPIIYKEEADFKNVLWTMALEYFNPRKSINHYIGLTKRTYLDFKDNEEVKLKKYFYILRPIFSAYWIKENNTIPTMEYHPLLKAMELNEEISKEIESIEILKAKTNETQYIPRNYTIDSFVEAGLLELENAVKNIEDKTFTSDRLDDLLYRLINED